jgi:TIGR03009 family protein
VFEFDHQNKQLKQRPLPPEMQGQQITDGPLPFLFGAKANHIKQRFWIRPIFPPERPENQHWLEAIPKTREDAANFRMIRIMIEQGDFLPAGMVLLHRNQEQTSFKFSERDTNWTQLNIFLPDDFAPKPPSGWTRVDMPAEQPIAAPPPTAARPALQPAPRRR